jgi:hypothetical protein
MKKRWYSRRMVQRLGIGYRYVASRPIKNTGMNSFKHIGKPAVREGNAQYKFGTNIIHLHFPDKRHKLLSDGSIIQKRIS